MAKLPRVTAKIFAGKAAENDLGQFGSALTGTKVTSNDISVLQAQPAFEEGWREAVISNRNYPTLQEMNCVQRIASQQIAYVLQNGMPEWDAGTEYYTNQFCRAGANFYYSLTDNNINNEPSSSPENWISWIPGKDEFANTSLSNLTDSGEAHFDSKYAKLTDLEGSWVKKTSGFLTSTDIKTYTIDLSSYLPNDGKPYEIFVNHASYNAATTESKIYIVTDILNKNLIMAPRSGSTQVINAFAVPIGSSRLLQYILEGQKAASINIQAYAYRRIR